MRSTLLNSPSMLGTVTYDRGPFMAEATWRRSYLAGAITTGVAGLSTYCTTLMMDPAFAQVVQRGLELKVAGSVAIVTMMGYSLIGLFKAICRDVVTQQRVKRANSWLATGSAYTVDLSDRLPMQQAQLQAARFVESEDGIGIFAAGRTEAGRDFLLEAKLYDSSYAAEATYFTHRYDIRSRLPEAFGTLAPVLARRMNIASSDPVPECEAEDVAWEEVRPAGQAHPEPLEIEAQATN